MSLVENLVNQISTRGLGGVTSPQGFDLDDDTFSKLLEKSMNANKQEVAFTDLFGEIGMPAGFVIEPHESIEFADNVLDQMEIIGEKKLINEPISTEPLEMKELNLGDYFSNLLKSESSNNSDLMNFAKKQATNFYNQYAKNLITDSTEFVQDVLSS